MDIMKQIELLVGVSFMLGVFGLSIAYWHAPQKAVRTYVKRTRPVLQGRHRNGQYATKAVTWINDSWKAGAH